MKKKNKIITFENFEGKTISMPGNTTLIKAMEMGIIKIELHPIEEPLPKNPLVFANPLS